MLRVYPYTEVIEHFDAVAPMVYWLNRQPESDVAGAVEWLKQFGKPIIPVGQAYDGGPEGGRPGVPPRDELLRFMDFAERHGASGVSFWSWQHATAEAWHAVRDAPQFNLPVKLPAEMRKGEVKAVETLLATSGYPVSRIDGTWDQSTTDAVATYQRAAGLEATGGFGPRTRELLLEPFSAPLGPLPKPKPAPKPEASPPSTEPEDETFVIAGES
jgi:peptidoglycan hydrolase-like protein with peptidoglycan-binding domain